MRLPCGCSCEARPTAYDGSMANGLTYQRTTTTPEATKQLAATLAPYLHAGDTIVLTGDLGGGEDPVRARSGRSPRRAGGGDKPHLQHPFGVPRRAPAAVPLRPVPAGCALAAGGHRLLQRHRRRRRPERPSWNGPRSSPRTCPTTIWRSPSQPTATAHGASSRTPFGSARAQLLCVWANDSKSRLGKCQL